MVLLLVAMAAALFGVSGVAYAMTVQCDGEGDQDPAPGVCLGWGESDNITGTTGSDYIDGQGGNDRIRALAGDDQVFTGGGGKDRVFLDAGNDITDAFGGNDVIYGGPDNDGSAQGASFGNLNLEGAEGSDVVYGEEGDDWIDAAANDTPGSRDRSYGGAGNDQIDAFDGNKDVINCGDGGGDIVREDEFDTTRNCETSVAP